MLRSPARFIAFGFGAGLAPFAPGTFGTLLALPLFWFLNPRFPPNQFLVLVALLYVLGIWACGRAGRDLGVEDYKGIVWDETVAFLLVLLFTPPILIWQAFAFLLFRLFDIWKPGPIRHIEMRFRGGFGVMIDDLVAAFFTLACLTLFRLFSPTIGGWLGFATV